MNYKAIKNELNNLVKNIRKTYYNNYFVRYKEDLQKVWKGIKDIISIRNKNTDFPTCISHNSRNKTAPTNIADKCNDFYTSIADNILENRKY